MVLDIALFVLFVVIQFLFAASIKRLVHKYFFSESLDNIEYLVLAFGFSIFMSVGVLFLKPLVMLAVLILFAVRLNAIDVGFFRKIKYQWIVFLLFVFLAPRAFNGFFRWDEMSYHLAYPTKWLNSDFGVDYSMRYPTGSIGWLAIIYFLLLAGTPSLVKLVSGYLGFLFVTYVLSKTRNHSGPNLKSILTLLLLFTFPVFHEVFFTAFQDGSLFLFSAPIVYRIIDDKESKVSFVLVVFCFSCAFAIKNFFIFYFFLWLLFDFFRFKRNVKYYCLACLFFILFNCIALVWSFKNSGDFIFPLTNLVLPSITLGLLDVRDIQGLLSSVSAFDVGFWEYFIYMIPALITTALILNRLNRGVIFLFVLNGLNYLLFPNIFSERYLYFFMPFVLFLFKDLKQDKWFYLSACLLICSNLTRAKPWMRNYLLPISSGINHSLIVSSWNDENVVKLFDYIEHNNIKGSILLMDLFEYRYFFIQRGFSVIGDDVGLTRFDRVDFLKYKFRYILCTRSLNFKMKSRFCVQEVFVSGEIGLYKVLGEVAEVEKTFD